MPLAFGKARLCPAHTPARGLLLFSHARDCKTRATGDRSFLTDHRGGRTSAIQYDIVTMRDHARAALNLFSFKQRVGQTFSCSDTSNYRKTSPFILFVRATHSINIYTIRSKNDYICSLLNHMRGYGHADRPNVARHTKQFRLVRAEHNNQNARR